MEQVDAALLEGRPPRVVFLPTAAAPEGDKMVAYWVELGRVHYRRLGIEAVPLMVLDRDDANDPEMAEQIRRAGLVYLSGGSPTYLAATLVGTLVSAAIHDVWRRGTAIAGCSAGAIALTETVPDIRDRRGDSIAGLGLVRGMSVIPHFDQIERWMPGAVQWAIDHVPAGVCLIGIDEDTAIVGGPDEWQVMGASRAWVHGATGRPVEYGAGAVLSLAHVPIPPP